jgi:hypothetical protein
MQNAAPFKWSGVLGMKSALHFAGGQVAYGERDGD